jgi:hypothetical protein
MALEKVISFDWGQDGEGGLARSSTSLVTYETTIVRTGPRSMKISNTSGNFSFYFTVPLDAALSEFYLQFGYYVAGGSQTGNAEILGWRKGSTYLGGLKLNTLNKLEIWTGNFVTKVAESSTPIPSSQWVVVEVYVKIADSGGVITLRQDMTEVATFSGDTKPGTETDVDFLIFGHASTSYTYFDDIVVHSTSGTANNSWPAGVKAKLCLPDGDGSLLQWTPTPSGTHYSTVDETPPSGTDYLQTAAVDQVDGLNFADLPAEAFSVKAVVAEAWALKGSTSPPTRLAFGLKIGGVDYFSGDKDLPTAQGFVQHIWNENPAGGGFSVSGVNAAQLLLKSRT